MEILTGPKWFICSVLTMDHQAVSDPAGFLQAGMPHQAVQLLAVHAAQRVERVLDERFPVFPGVVLGVAGQLRVPGQPGSGVAHGPTGGDKAERLAFHQVLRFHGGDGKH